MRIVRLMGIFLQLMTVEPSQAGTGAYPHKSLFIRKDTPDGRRKTFLQGDLLVIVMPCL